MRLIDADALKEDLTRFYDNEVTARKLIDEQPTIQPEPHWIPVTERLPEINEDILLSYFDEVTLGWLCGDGSWMIFDGQECVGANEVSAWMPLPEPYKGVTDGRD